MIMRRLLLAGSIAILGAFVAQAQGEPHVQMASSPTPNVVISRFDNAQFPAFEKFLSSEKVPLQRASFVLTNNSDKAIVGIDVEWLTTDKGGRQRHYSFRSDRYLSPGPGTVALAHDRLLVAPGIFIPESLLASGAGYVRGDFSKGLEGEFAAAAEITVSLDCLIFEDGEVTGPNLKRFTDELQMRRFAADAVMKRVRSAIQRGQQPSVALAELLDTPPRTGDFLGKWEHNFAKDLSRSGNFEMEKKRLENLPSPPTFYRANGGSL